MNVQEMGDFLGEMAVMMNENKGQVSHESIKDFMIPYLIDSLVDLLW